MNDGCLDRMDVPLGSRNKEYIQHFHGKFTKKVTARKIEFGYEYVGLVRYDSVLLWSGKWVPTWVEDGDLIKNGIMPNILLASTSLPCYFKRTWKCIAHDTDIFHRHLWLQICIHAETKKNALMKLYSHINFVFYSLHLTVLVTPVTIFKVSYSRNTRSATEII